MFKLLGSEQPIEKIYGPYNDFYRRTASQKQSPELMNIFPFFDKLVRSAASVYDISDDPNNYVFAQVRALHADKVNGNGDVATTGELIQYRPNLETFVFKSFIGKPHLLEHDDTDLRTSHGILVDASIHLDERDKPVRVLIAVDKKKFPEYAAALLSGQKFGYSMGATAQYTRCNHCANIATADHEWCDCMREFKGRFRKGCLMSESIHCLEYQELSKVAGPADKGAVGEYTLSAAKPESQTFSVFSNSNPTPDPNWDALRATIREGISKGTPWRN